MREDYFPPPDSKDGWRVLRKTADIMGIAQMDKEKLENAFEFVKTTTKNGGLLVVRKGWLVYERYFGKGNRESTPNLASCGKVFTSIAVGILMSERPDLFADGLEQKIFTPIHLPRKAFPLSDPAKSEIKLGQLLCFTCGIRGSYGGNNASFVYGKEVMIDPQGPDGWQAMDDEIALGLKDDITGCYANGRILSTRTLWCKPGEGYSYATSAIHIASIMLRHITGMELQAYVKTRLAIPLEWGRWNYGYRFADLKHTPGGGGIVLRPSDVLRYAYMLLREGRWHDKQIVPSEYIHHCSRQSPYNPHFPYSLQFDVNSSGQCSELPRDAFWKSGFGVHAFYIVPSLDLVVFKMGGTDLQYHPEDTGLPILSEVAEHEEPRENWVPLVDEDTAIRKTLQMVVSAIRS